MAAMVSPRPGVALGDRSLFPALGDRAYLAHAAIAPPSENVRTAAEAVLADYASHGAAAWVRYRDQRDQLRVSLAQLIGATADEIALVASTSMGVLDIALCLDWRAGERVLLFDGEFPANVTAWQQAAQHHGLEVVRLPVADFAAADDRGLRRLEEVLAGGVRLVAVSAVQFQSGLAMPLAAIAERCRRWGAELFVDAIQAVGVLPIDVHALGLDYLAAGSHKWLMGLEGAGLLYVRRERQPGLRPVVAGWLSHEDPAAFLFEGAGHLRYDRPIRRGVDFLEFGALNTVGFAALGAAVEDLLALGVDSIHAHVQRILDALEPRLVALGFTSCRPADAARRAGILAVQPPADSAPVAELGARLAELGVDVSTPDGLLRLAPHWPNGLDQVDAVVDAFARCRHPVDGGAR